MRGNDGFKYVNIHYVLNFLKISEPGQCALEVIRSLLDVDCEVAIVIVNIVGFGLFAILMLTCFLFIKHRYVSIALVRKIFGRPTRSCFLI